MQQCNNATRHFIILPYAWLNVNKASQVSSKANRAGELHGQKRAERLDPISSLGKLRSVSFDGYWRAIIAKTKSPSQFDRLTVNFRSGDFVNFKRFYSAAGVSPPSSPAAGTSAPSSSFSAPSAGVSVGGVVG